MFTIVNFGQLSPVLRSCGGVIWYLNWVVVVILNPLSCCLRHHLDSPIALASNFPECLTPVTDRATLRGAISDLAKHQLIALQPFYGLSDFPLRKFTPDLRMGTLKGSAVHTRNLYPDLQMVAYKVFPVLIKELDTEATDGIIWYHIVFTHWLNFHWIYTFIVSTIRDILLSDKGNLDWI